MRDDPIRAMTEADLPAVVRLMAESFPRRDEAYFERGFERLAAAPVPDGYERYGFVIDDEDGIGGAVLAIPSTHDYGGSSQVFVNISTWCVAPSRRGPLAKALYDRAGARHEAVNTNLSAALHTIKTLDRLNFHPWTTGQFLALDATGRGGRAMRHDAPGAPEVPAHHARVLEDHASLDCRSVVLETDAAPIPLVLLPRRVGRIVPVAQLIYCESLADLSRHGRALMRWARRSGFAGVLIDADGPVPGFRGRYYAGKAAKYIRGATPRYDVEHTYSEMVRLRF